MNFFFGALSNTWISLGNYLKPSLGFNLREANLEFFHWSLHALNHFHILHLCISLDSTILLHRFPPLLLLSFSFGFLLFCHFYFSYFLTLLHPALLHHLLLSFSREIKASQIRRPVTVWDPCKTTASFLVAALCLHLQYNLMASWIPARSNTSEPTSAVCRVSIVLL